jgi:Rad3-related DNA helicase
MVNQFLHWIWMLNEKRFLKYLIFLWKSIVNDNHSFRFTLKKRIIITTIKDHQSSFQNVNKISPNYQICSSHFSGPKKLHYWCLSPGFAMRQLCMQNTRSILLTSGTLSPIDSFKTQLAM